MCEAIHTFVSYHPTPRAVSYCLVPNGTPTTSAIPICHFGSDRAVLTVEVEMPITFRL